MDEAIKFVKNPIAVSLHVCDESFNSGECGDLGDELVRSERSCGTLRHYSGEEVANLEAWLEVFLPQAEYLVQLVTELSVGLSQEQGREAWAVLESEAAALRRASCGMGSPAVSEAAGNFELLAEVLEQRSLQIRGW